MKQSSQRILTTHTGSLPRPPDVQQMLEALDRGEQVDFVAFETRVREAVQATIQQQVACGIDVVNDGEMSKISYSTYVKDRLTGFEGRSQRQRPVPPDLVDFPEYAARRRGGLSQFVMPTCTGSISYVGKAALERDCANLKAALQGVNAPEAFMTAASPGVISRFLENQYYPTHEAYLFALADAMKQEYDTIYQAGFLLQLDCPDLTGILASEQGTGYRALHIEALNHAVRDIPPDRMLLHVCWGNYEYRDVEITRECLLRQRASCKNTWTPALFPRGCTRDHITRMYHYETFSRRYCKPDPPDSRLRRPIHAMSTNGKFLKR